MAPELSTGATAFTSVPVVGRLPVEAELRTGAAAFTNVAIDQAQRAVQDCLLSRGLT